LPRRKVEKSEVLKVAEEILGTEEFSQMVEEIAKTLNIEPKDVIKTALLTGLKGYQWGKLSTADVIACANFLAYLDALFYRRIYVESPIESVIKQADKFSEATRKILEGYGGGLRATVEKVLEEKLRKMEEQEGGGEKGKKQQNQGLLDKMLDNIMGYIADELGARLSKEVADAVAPELREIILKMIKEGRIKIELAGEEVVKE